MKRFSKNIVVGLFCGLVLLSTACTNLDEFDSSKLADSVEPSLVITQRKDSAVQITVSNPSDGYITLGLLEDPGEELDLDPKAFFEQKSEEVVTYVTFKAKKDSTYQVHFDELVQYTDYLILGVSSNADGVIGEIVDLSFTTSDSHGPILVATSPEVGTAPEMPLNGELVLEFDEAVIYDTTKVLQYYFSNDSITVLNNALDVTVEGKRVTITSDSLLRNGEVVFVSWAEGVFKDVNNNPVKAKSSDFDDEGYPYGLYFTAESNDFTPTIMPAVNDTVSIADVATIVLTFDEEVVGFHDDYEAGSTLSFKDADGSSFIKMLKKTDFFISGKKVTLTAPMPATSGQKVTLMLNASTFYVGIYNPNAAVKASWVVE